MKIVIEVGMGNAALVMPGELTRILSTVEKKVEEQWYREPGCLCDAPEDADLLRDINGNVVGSVRLEYANDEATVQGR